MSKEEPKGARIEGGGWERRDEERQGGARVGKKEKEAQGRGKKEFGRMR